MAKEIFHYDELFSAVQQASIFEDGKTFVDCTPKRSLDEINRDFQQEKKKQNFDLRSFVANNFTRPKEYQAVYKTDTTRPLGKHIESLWNELTRKPSQQEGTMIPIPHPYIVPGGRFREIYYWDSFFTMLGLQVSGRADMIRNMILNFSHLIDSVGYIPNGNRSYFIGRSQPPFFSSMVELLSETDRNVILEFLPHLEKEYTFWMQGSPQLSQNQPALHRTVLLPDGSILNRYWDENDTPRPESYKEDVELSHQSNQSAPVLFRHIRAAAESGWDFSTRWFKDAASFESIHTTEIIPVDLNCLLYHLEQTLSTAWLKWGDSSKSGQYRNLAERRKQAIMRYCWNPSEGFFFDYDFVIRQQKKYLTLAGVFPLYFKIASQVQASAVKEVVQRDFLKQGGLITTLERSGQQWDAPNGWAPLQWIAYKSFRNYGFDELAEELRKRWLALTDAVYKETGKMMEKYNVMDTSMAGGGGEYPNQDGFGWTNGVTAAMLVEKGS